MVQLWVNLPSRDKMAPAGYQTLLDAEIPAVDLPDGAGKLRIIAGDHDGRHGPARTFTPIDVWDVRLNAGRAAGFDIAEGRTLAAIVLKGTALVNGQEVVRDAQMVVFDREAGRIEIEANSDVKLLILGGEPIDEPIVGYGPFVMTSQDEIRQAITDFNKGDFGKIAH
jgi:redox-sensitive bicupin YhaK (pirin superfamily)